MRYLRMTIVVALMCLSVFTATAAGVVQRLPNGHRISLMLRAGARGSSAGLNASGGVLVSHGGPVLSATAPYLIFWTPSGHSIAASSEGLLGTYLSDVAAAASAGSTTNVYSVLAQYGSPYRQTFTAAQSVIDTKAYPTRSGGCKLATGMSACLTDAALRGEITSLISAARLPNPSAPGTGTTPVFFVITPANTNVCTSAGSCASNSFCAYHNFFTHNGTDILYSSVPYAVFASSTKGCQTDGNPVYETPVGSSGDQAYNIADDLSHELSETITDPLINAWYATNGYEVGDLCEQYGATVDPSKGISPLAYAPAFGNASSGVLYDQVVNGHQYYNQTEFSNSAGGCRAGVTPLP